MSKTSQTSRGGDSCRRRLAFDHLAEAAADARELEDGYLRCGQWSLAQACEHLSIFMRLSLDGFPGRRLPGPLRLAMRTLLLSGPVMRRPMPKGIRAPAYLQPPDAAAGATYEAATDADRAAVDRFAGVCRQVELHRGDFAPSPLFGKLAPDKWRRVHRKHAEHHLGFLVPTANVRRDEAGSTPARGRGAGSGS